MRRRILKPQFAESSRLIPISRILLVDDDEDDREYHTSVLEGQGHLVFRRSSFADAAELAESERFALALLSQGGPAFEGRPLLERLRKPDRLTPVVVLARVGDVRSYVEAMELGAMDYVEKPVHPAQMKRLVQHALEAASAAM